VSDNQTLFAAATVLGALGLWQMLPGARSGIGRVVGPLASLVSLGLFGYLAPRLMLDLGAADASMIAGQVIFWLLAAVTVISAAAAVTMRSPVYSAIWFALTLLGSAALMMFQGAQFLAVATVVVYAGAILVTFLFVLMLAQPEGQSHYDRVCWEPLLSACTGAVLIGILTLAMHTSFTGGEGPVVASAAAAESSDILTTDHMARLGTELFGRHLIAVEVAGTLLMVALVGAIAITAHGRTGRGKETAGGRRDG